MEEGRAAALPAPAGTGPPQHSLGSPGPLSHTLLPVSPSAPRL